PNGGTLSIQTSNAWIDESYTRKHLTPLPGDYVRLDVCDTGIGIDPDVQGHLFEPFVTTKDKGKGTGLGLSTSYGVIKQLGGEITFTSQPGVGTTFSIYLPVAEPQADSVESPQRRSVSRGTETILLVEDDEAVRGVIETILVRNGYHVLCSAS